MSKYILVTGGAGYIGSHVCKALHRAGYCPVAYDNLDLGNAESVKWGPLIIGDIADHSALEATLRKFEINCVLHFAASAYVGESILNPRKYFANNLQNTIAMLDTMLECGVRGMVFSSTCATYGLPRSAYINEQHQQVPINPYGESKLCIEKILRWYRTCYGFNSIALRYFNAAGADPEGEIGEQHNPETHLIPLAICAGTDSEKFFEIYGIDHETPDGTAIRDFVHVTDLAEAHVLALETLGSHECPLALNLGTGSGYSVQDVLTEVKQLCKVQIRTKICSKRPGDPARLVADPSLAWQWLGWKARHSSLSDIVSSALNWHLSNSVGTIASGTVVARPRALQMPI